MNTMKENGLNRSQSMPLTYLSFLLMVYTIYLLPTYIDWTFTVMTKLVVDNLVDTLVVVTIMGYIFLAIRKAKKHLIGSCIP